MNFIKIDIETGKTIVSMILIVSIIEPAKATGSMGSPLCGCMYVWMCGSNELISETAPPIFLKLGMKLGDNKGKKIARPDF